DRLHPRARRKERQSLSLAAAVARLGGATNPRSSPVQPTVQLHEPSRKHEPPHVPLPHHGRSPQGHGGPYEHLVTVDATIEAEIRHAHHFNVVEYAPCLGHGSGSPFGVRACHTKVNSLPPPFLTAPPPRCGAANGLDGRATSSDWPSSIPSALSPRRHPRRPHFGRCRRRWHAFER